MALSNFTGGNPTGTPGGPSGPGLPIGGGTGGTDPLELLINYNQKFASAGTILFRDEVIQQVLAVLIAKNKPNALLIGSAGVGKTKIVEDIAYRIMSKDPMLPAALTTCTIYELPLSNIVAGSCFVGDVEKKIKAVLDFATDPANNVILFIDEIHQLVGDSQTYEKIAQILKPALSRGDLKVIGATTLQESGKLMDDPALNRRFSRIIVDEFTREQTVEILKNTRANFIQHYNNKISISDDVMETLAVLADEYKPAGSHRPDNAITLLDRTCGDAIVARKVAERDAQNDPALLAAIQAVPIIPITEKQIKRTAMRIMTGNAKKHSLDIDAMKDALSVIQGQDEIIEQMLKLLRKDDLALFPKTRPLAVLFAGNSGVGKTEITKIIAQELTGVKPITLNMTEYHSPASINRIIGSPAGYIGSDSNAELPFDSLESNPYQVILLDEFEKGDKSVQRLFMSALDEGYIKTNRGKTIDFSRAIIVATTNAGHTSGATRKLGFSSGEDGTQPPIRDAIQNLSAWFDVELLNRFEAVLTFNDLPKDVYRNIVAENYKLEVARILKDKPRLPLMPEIPDDKLDEIVQRTYVPEFGARPANKAVREFIEDQV